MAQKGLIKHKHNYIRSYRFRKTDEEISVAITIHPHASFFFPNETPELDSAKNMQLKHIKCLLLRFKSSTLDTTQTKKGL